MTSPSKFYDDFHGYAYILVVYMAVLLTNCAWAFQNIEPICYFFGDDDCSASFSVSVILLSSSIEFFIIIFPTTFMLFFLLSITKTPERLKHKKWMYIFRGEVIALLPAFLSFSLYKSSIMAVFFLGLGLFSGLVYSELLDWVGKHFDRSKQKSKPTLPPQ